MAVAALALQSIALLCQDDVLEFYAAWRVVQTALPKLPSQVGPKPFSRFCGWCLGQLPPLERTSQPGVCVTVCVITDLMLDDQERG